MKTKEERNAHRRAWRQRPEVRERELALRRKAYRENLEHNRKLLRGTRARHLEDRRRRSREWYYANKQRASENHKRWCKTNRPKINAYSKRRFNGSIRLRISSITKHRIWEVISDNGKRKVSKPFRFLGCDKQFLVHWLEKQFQPGMSWDNYGQYGWHIDHIRPLASFDLADENQQKIAFHYTNLQPLWWRDNLSKHAKWQEAA